MAGIVRPPNDGGPGSGLTLDVFGLPGAVGRLVVNPLVVWLVTAAGGTMLYLRLLRRTGDEDELPVLAFAGAAPAGSVDAMPDTRPTPAHVVETPSRPVVPPPVAVGARLFQKGPGKGVERATIGYHQVRISSNPDDLRSDELGRLDRGDEVEIVDSFEGFLQIRTPDAIVGWIPRHVIVGAPKQGPAAD